MKLCRHILFIQCLFISFLPAQNSPELDALRGKMESLRVAYDEPIEAWHGKYLAQLKSLEQTAKEAGDLDQIFALREEREKPGVDKIDPRFKLLKKARRIYEKRLVELTDQRMAKLTSAMKNYRKRLFDLQRTYTQQNNIELALLVREEINRLDDPLPVRLPSRETTKGLIAHWKLDGDAKDATANKLDGAVKGDRPFGPGKFGQALLTGDRRSVSIPTVNLPRLGDRMTLAFWFKLDPSFDQPNWGALLSGVGGNDPLIVQFDGAKDGRFYCKSGREIRTRHEDYNDGKWHHLAVVINDKTLTCFFDGFREAERTDSKPFEVNLGTKSFCIGLNPGLENLEATAWIDEVRLYDRALDENELMQLGALHLPARREPAPKTKRWKSLLQEKYTHIAGSEYFMKHLNVKGVAGAPEAGGRGMHKTQTDTMIAAHAKGRIDYAFERPITEFKAIGRLLVSKPGDGVAFEVQAEGRPVFVSGILDGGEKVEIHAVFNPAKRITLLTHENRQFFFDHSVWDHPEFR